MEKGEEKESGGGGGGVSRQACEGEGGWGPLGDPAKAVRSPEISPDDVDGTAVESTIPVTPPGRASSAGRRACVRALLAGLAGLRLAG
ncbi:hypothetical protein Dda_9110 [Drechslerella dactyloides]|uniref:Uncharacterized protein n=1 Tax=Drechslerella dactyloides TaxID=74499 RepID=A0AAD6IPL4_DREDA|nr:hypothetical protein Dda_9110 [Drechslerella dactyloides]